MQLHGTSAIYQQKHATNHFIFYANHKLVPFMQEFVWVMVTIGFGKGLPSSYVLKGQTEQHLAFIVVTHLVSPLVQKCSNFAIAK